jgi:hypothetical protein
MGARKGFDGGRAAPILPGKLSSISQSTLGYRGIVLRAGVGAARDASPAVHGGVHCFAPMDSPSFGEIIMTINVKAYANADDILIAWQPGTWSNDWVGFQLERRNNITQQTTVLSNRIPPKPGEKPVADAGISSTHRRSGAASGPITASSTPTTSPTASPR